MALSNWDTLAVDLKGEPQAGWFESPGGVRVEIYKNWLYVHDTKAWREKGSYSKDTVMQIQHGELHYHDVEIRAIRGPQNGVYVGCWHAEYNSDPKVPTEYTGIFGCGVYGYDDKTWVGVTPECVEFLQKFVSHKERMWTDEEIEEMVATLANPDLSPEEYRQWLQESFDFDFPEEIMGVKFDQAMRYNQGNMYFAEKVGMDLEATKPGNSEEPTMNSLIDQMKSGL